MLETFVLTSDRDLWTVRVCAHLFRKHGGQDRPVTVLGFSPPDFDLPPLWTFLSIGEQADYPIDRWSDALIGWLKGGHRPADVFALLLSDYWLMRQASWPIVDVLADWAMKRPRLLRLDLTLDRANERGAVDVAYLAFLDIIKAPATAPYKVSLQAAIWNRDLLLSVLKPGLSPWDVELSLSPELHGRQDLRVIGTRQCPVRYINVFKNSEGQALHGLDRLPLPERQEIEGFGWLQPG